jgi:hypothetical protein
MLVSLSSWSKPLLSWVFALAKEEYGVLLKELLTMVRQRKGAPTFLVRRIEAEVALRADLRARWRDWRGTSRFMALPAADWMV